VNLLGRQRPPWEQILMAREAVEPTPAFRSIIDNAFGPLRDKMNGLIAELTGLPPGDEHVAFIAASIFGQIVYYFKNPHTIEQMHPQFGKRPPVERIADHIADFSLAGARLARQAVDSI
jgi:hypothetical protein